MIKVDWIEGLNKSIEYIEENLTETIEMEKAAQLAACSVFQYQRIFPYIAGVTISEYSRRRRMSAAAFDLINGHEKIIDLSLKYGYESPTAFNRAFQSVHGISPSKAKSEGVRLTTFPRITFTLSIKGEEAMDYKIKTKKSFRIVGFSLKEPMTMEECFEKVPQFWKNVGEQGGIDKLCALMDGSEPEGILGVSTCDKGDFSGYFIAVATEKPVPDGMEEYIIPETTYAMFESVGPMPESIQNTQQRIISEWLPTSGYEYAAAPDIEVYPERYQQAEDYRSEVWLPIVKK